MEFDFDDLEDTVSTIDSLMDDDFEFDRKSRKKRKDNREDCGQKPKEGICYAIKKMMGYEK